MIPGFIISWITFPGVIVHEAAHLLFCRWFGLTVIDVQFFRLAATGPAGYVIHERSNNFWADFFVSVGPFLVNSILCFLICLPIFLPIRVFGVMNAGHVILGWLGLSIGMHAFPSTQDAQTLWSAAKRQAGSGNILALLTLPVVGLIYLGNIGSFFWADLLYAGAIGLGLPELILRWVL